MIRLKLSAVLIISLLLCCSVTSQLIRPDIMNLGIYNPETKHYEKESVLLGRNDHDKTPHQHPNLGGDDHDKKPHGQHILGGDDHDRLHHGQHQLGGDGHDMKPHGQHILGGDDHDRRPHHQILGSGYHDRVPHHRQKNEHNGVNQRTLPVREDHARQQLLGRGNHDRLPHFGQALEEDTRDHVPHQEQKLNIKDHDIMFHGPWMGAGDHDHKPHGMHLLGGDDHDKVNHLPVFGGGDHDRKPHRVHLLGGDGHDKINHLPVFGGGDHDRKPHGVHLLGGDDHDEINHLPVFGGGDHDHKPHGVHILGGDDHDKVNHLPVFGDHNKKPHVKRVNVVLAFREFMLQHDKVYSGPAEFRKRFSIFRHNLQRIRQAERAESGTATYGITKFADLSEREFRIMLGFRPELRRPSEHRERVTDVPHVQLPRSFDWRDYNVVTPIKDQGMCGSCWAFSTTGNVEGQWALKNKQLLSLSEQELVDCDSEDHGCEGGLPENAYDAIMKLGGLETENEYPYNGQDGTCHMEVAKVEVKVNGSVELPQDENQLARWLYKNGPVSIGINANALQFYTGGVSHPLRVLCNPKHLNHGMLIIGFGTHTTKYLHRKQPYWLIKNSWGRNWGEQGYYRVYRGDGTCGVNMMATSSIVP